MNIITFGRRLRPLGFKKRHSGNHDFWQVKFKNNFSGSALPDPEKGSDNKTFTQYRL